MKRSSKRILERSQKNEENNQIKDTQEEVLQKNDTVENTDSSTVESEEELPEYQIVDQSNMANNEDTNINFGANDEHGRDEEIEPERNVRQRNNPVVDLERLAIYENGNPNHVIHDSYVFRSVREMVNPTIPTVTSKIVGRLLRITNSSDKSGNKNGYTYRYSKKNEKTQNSGCFRLLLFQDLKSVKGDVFYVKVSSTKKSKIWSKLINERDTGPLSIGSILIFLGPNPVKEVFCNDILILPSTGSSILMKEPAQNILPNIWPTFEESESNKTSAFKIRANLVLKNLSVAESNCTGLFCDRQNLDENSNYGCGCYQGSDTRHAKLVLSFCLEIEDGNNSFEVEDFSSHRFTQYFLQVPFPSTTCYNAWDHTPKYMDLVARINRILTLVNQSGKWSVIGWCKRGEINDQNFSEEVQKVTSADVKHHVTSIFPYNTDGDVLKNSINQLKYDNTELDLY